MPLTRYTGNHSPSEWTGEIRLAPEDAKTAQDDFEATKVVRDPSAERVLEQGGDPVWLTDAEYSSLASRFKLEKVDEEVDVAEEDDEPEAKASAPVSMAPAQFGAQPSPPATPGASGSTSPPATP